MLQSSVAWRFGIGFVLTLSARASLAQSTLYVDAGASGANNGSSWCDAYVDLPNALSAAGASGGAVSEIRVAGGIYRPITGPYQTTGQRSATLRLVSGVALLGGYAGCGSPTPDARDFSLHESILSGDLLGNDGPAFTNYEENSYQIVTYDDPAAQGVVLDGFTIAGGNADGASPLNQGGGVHIRSGTTKCIPGGPTIRNCILRDNRANHHGAINDHGLGTVIENCTFRDNFAGEEGAGLLIHSGPTQVTNCEFINNTVDGEGGGAWAGHDDDASCTAPSQPNFVNCTFRGNRANGSVSPGLGKGGGLFSEFNSPSLTQCVFENNEAVFQGGGINADRTGALIQDCTFRDNSSAGVEGILGSGNGGGAWLRGESLLFGGTPRVLRSSFAGNFADSYGGGLSLQDSAARVAECDFTGNSADGRGGAIRISGGQPRIVRCTFEANDGGYHGGGLGVESPGGHVFLWNSIFRRNSAGGGGALWSHNAAATVGNCSFTGNHAGYGGAVDLGTSVATFINDTFAANTVFNMTGEMGVGTVGSFSSFNNVSPSQVTFQNCILWNGVQPFRNQDASVITISHSDVRGGWLGVGNVSTNPYFGDPDGPDDVIGTADDNFQLCSGSGAYSAGSNAALPADVADVDGDGDTAEIVPLDLAGSDRISAGSVDMGAYEGASQICPPPFCLYGDVNTSGAVNFGDVALIVQAFQGRAWSIAYDDADIFPCGGNGTVSFQDASAAVATFRGAPPCGNVCYSP